MDDRTMKEIEMHLKNISKDAKLVHTDKRDTKGNKIMEIHNAIDEILECSKEDMLNDIVKELKDKLELM